MVLAEPSDAGELTGSPMEQLIESLRTELTQAERDQLTKSADAVKGLIDACKKLEPKLA